MKFSVMGVCDICHKARGHGNHAACSAQRKKTTPPSKAPKRLPYDTRFTTYLSRL